MAVFSSRTRWRRIQRLFAEVVALEPARREARLDRACRGDPALRAEVEALLERHARGELIGVESGAVGPPEGGAPSPPAEEAKGGEKAGDGEKAGGGELFAGRYRLVGELGRGAMGVVHRALDTRLDRYVAVKVLSPHLATDAKARARLLAEAYAVAAVDHPNLCTIYEAGETDDGRLFLAMACYDGETLAARLERGPLSPADAVRIATDVARGLGAAHRRGIVHRDVKPSNVLLTDDGLAKLLDFGIARSAGTDLTKTGDTLGTAAYMSPEQLRGHVDPRTDLWALGVVLFEMLAGRRPFAADYEAALFYAIVHEPPPSLSALRPDAPPALAGVVERCLEKDPEERFQSAEEVEAALEQGQPTTRTRPAPPAPSKRRVLIVAVLALVGVLIPASFEGVRTAGLGWLGMGPVPDEKRIAVIPFSVAGSDENAEAFSAGLTEVLASTLTQIERFGGKLWVVPTSEVRGRDVTSAEEARKAFGVNLVVTGSVQREAGRVRATLNLIDAETLLQLRSRVTNVHVTELNALQDELVGILEAMLDLELGEEPRRVIAATSTPVPGAYDYYLQGLGYLQRYESTESLDNAISLFERALEEDPEYALAHAGLGEAYWRQFEGTQDERWVPDAVEHIGHALSLEPQLPPALVTLGLIYVGTGRAEEAVAEFERALAADPTSAPALRGLARAHAALGNTDEAEAIYRRAIELRPDYWGGYNDLGVFYTRIGLFNESVGPFRRVTELTPDNARGYSNLGGVYFYLGRLEEAAAMFEQSLMEEPSYGAYSNLGTLYYYGGRYTDAARMYEAALAMNDQDPSVWGNLASAYYWSPAERGRADETYRTAVRRMEEQAAALGPMDPMTRAILAGYHVQLGDEAEARALIAEALAEAPEDNGVAFQAAFVFERLGEREEALQWLHRTIELGYPHYVLEGEPGLRDLRADPRFTNGNE